MFSYNKYKKYVVYYVDKNTTNISSIHQATFLQTMDLVVEPEVYSPYVDIQGNYIDKTPCFSKLPNGLRCPCGGRKEKYSSASAFTAHTKTKTHQKWLSHLTANKANFYTENEEYKLTIHNQKLIIARMEQEIQNRNRTIDYLTQQLTQKPDLYTHENTISNTLGDLLEFD